MAEPRRVYWDSCVWISLINDEEGRARRCAALIELARKGDVEIVTSSLTLVEVHKMRRRGDDQDLERDRDRVFEDFLLQDFVVEVQVDHTVAVKARELLRLHRPPLKKPQDAIHLATAVLSNVDELNTFDGEDLLRLAGQVARADGVPLEIREPQEIIAGQGDMFAGTDAGAGPAIQLSEDP